MNFRGSQNSWIFGRETFSIASFNQIILFAATVVATVAIFVSLSNEVELLDGVASILFSFKHSSAKRDVLTPLLFEVCR